jgi:hypothetical protein
MENSMRPCDCPKYNLWLGYWRERAQVSPAQPTIITFHNIVDIDKQLQRFWELEEMFPSINRLTAEEAACEQHFIDSNNRAEDERYTVNQPMKQTKDQPLAIEPLQLYTKHKTVSTQRKELCGI